MAGPKLQFVIPTYCLHDVGESVEAYDANLQRSGQSAPIIVFDDSFGASREILRHPGIDPDAGLSTLDPRARTRPHGVCSNRGAAGSSRDFAVNLSRTFYNFEPDFFQQNVSGRADNEVGLIRSTLEIWPTRLEIVYFKKNCRQLPLRRVHNRDPLRSEKAATI